MSCSSVIITIPDNAGKSHLPHAGEAPGVVYHLCRSGGVRGSNSISSCGGLVLLIPEGGGEMVLDKSQDFQACQ